MEDLCAKIGGARGYYTWLTSVCMPGIEGDLARAFLTELGTSLAGIRASEFAKIFETARRATLARRAGGKLYAFLHGHAILDRMGCPHDPHYFSQYNRASFDPRPGVDAPAGDLILFIGHAGLPIGDGFEKHAYPDAWRKTGATITWSFGRINDATFHEDAARIRTDEISIDQHMYEGDGSVDLPGYPIRVFPTSGVTSETVLWMVNAEVHRLVKASGW